MTGILLILGGLLGYSNPAVQSEADIIPNVSLSGLAVYDGALRGVFSVNADLVGSKPSTSLHGRVGG